MASLTPGTWTLDVAHSEIGMTVRHAGISKVRAVFTDAEATLAVAEEGTSSVETAVKVGSFDSKNADRDAHVLGEDFLDVETHPELTFTARDFTPAGEEFQVTGDMTIRGETRPVTFDVEYGGQAVDPFGATRAGFSASAVISRKDFGLTWNATLEAGGVLVGDKVTIDLEAAFVLEQDA